MFNNNFLQERKNMTRRRLSLNSQGSNSNKNSTMLLTNSLTEDSLRLLQNYLKVTHYFNKSKRLILKI
jgi:hypothetical protein